MKQIVSHRRKDVFYDEDRKEYICVFKPKWNNRLKFFLRFRKYPGHNFKFISDELNKLGIKTPKVVAYDKYKVVTKEVVGEDLNHYRELEKYPELWEDFVSIVVKILKADIYSGDLHYGNFIYSKGEIYLLDLEDYRKVTLCKRDNKEMIRRISGKIDAKIYQAIIERVKK